MEFIPPLPEEVRKAMEEMGGRNISEVRLVIQKKLSATDASTSNNRLSVPVKKIIGEDFLTEEEAHYLRGHEGSNTKFINVTIIEPSLGTETVDVCLWDMPAKQNDGETSSIYFIFGKWHGIVRRNGLRVGMVVQLWSFRVDGSLCLALVRLPTN